MKKRDTILLILMMTFSFQSCVKDSDFSIPDISIEEPNIKVTNSIASIKAMYSYKIVDFSSVENDVVIAGYVVSSDEAGNMYKTISIQDKPENPTAAIQLLVDDTNLSAFYEVGRKVYVKLNGLALAKNRGVLEIGVLNKSKVERISRAEYRNVILRSKEVAEIVPLIIDNISDLDDSYLSMLITLNHLRPVEKDITYADVNFGGSVDRILESCEDKAKIAMRNSGYASFKGQQIPNKKGSISAVLGKYNDLYQLIVRDTEDVKFTEIYDCGDLQVIPLKNVEYLRTIFAGDELVFTEEAKLEVVITSDKSKNNIKAQQAFAQDSSGGLLLNFETEHSFNLGEKIVINLKDLKLTNEQSIFQLNLPESAIISSEISELPSPAEVTLTQVLDGDYECELVKINEVQFLEPTKTYKGENSLTSNCNDALSMIIRENASFSQQIVNANRGSVTGVVTKFNNLKGIYIRDESDVYFFNDYEVCSNNTTNTQIFDFEDLKTSSTSYSKTGTLSSKDGTILDYKGRTNVGKYAINGRGLMMKDKGFIKINFVNGVKTVSFKYRAAFTSTTERVIYVYQGDENSTTLLEEIKFNKEVTLGDFIINLNENKGYVLTLKAGAKQVVFDDITFNY